MSDTVPVIDIARIGNARTLRELHRACRDWGFFQVVNHGIHSAAVASLFDAMHAFFAQPEAAKQAISRTLGNPWGYYDKELTKNIRDWKEVYDVGPPDGAARTPQWPGEVAGFRPAIETWSKACETLAFRLLSALSMNLGLPGEHLAQWFGDRHTSFLRLNHYPVCPQPAAPPGLETTRPGTQAASTSATRSACRRPTSLNGRSASSAASVRCPACAWRTRYTVRSGSGAV